MMDCAALKIAMDLVHVPSRVRQIRSAPLPDGVETLLRIAAGDEEEISKASVVTGRSPATVREAGAFFIEQILFSPDTDSYRVLGLNPGATSDELRRNMALLLRWLHPDVDTDGKRSVFVGRVTHAWNDLKTQERRGAYDRSRRVLLAEQSFLRKKARAPNQKKNGGSSKRVNNNGAYRRHVASGRLDTRTGERKGFLQHILLVLFGRAKH